MGRNTIGYGNTRGSNLGPQVVSNETKLSRYVLNGGEGLVHAAIDAFRKSEAVDEFFLGKAEGLCMAISHASGVELGWVRDYISAEAF